MLLCFNVFDVNYSAILCILCRCFLVLPTLGVPILPSQCVTPFCGSISLILFNWATESKGI